VADKGRGEGKGSRGIAPRRAGGDTLEPRGPQHQRKRAGRAAAFKDTQRPSLGINLKRGSAHPINTVLDASEERGGGEPNEAGDQDQFEQRIPNSAHLTFATNGSLGGIAVQE
jgi:hypothetical protein